MSLSRAFSSTVKNAILEYGFRQQQARDAALAKIAQGMRPQQQFSPEDLAQIERLKPIAQTAPASQPMTDDQRIEAFARQFNPAMRAQQPTEPQVGSPEPALPGVDQASVDVAGPEMLQQVGFVYMRHGQGEAGLKLLQLADEQRKTREMAGFYQQILATPGGDPQIRNQALAALGSLMMQTGKSAQALQVLKGAIPPSLLDMIEKTTAETKHILLGQKRAQRGKRSLAKAEAHAKRAIFEAQPRQTAADAGITTTASGERVRTTHPTEHGHR
jgi:hypothetical protein